MDSAVDRTVGDEHQKLSSEPPNTQRPSGAPRTLEGKPKTDAPAEYSNAPAQKTNAPEKKNAEVKDQKKPEGKIPAEEVEEPSGWDTLLMGLGYAIGKFASLFDSDVKPEDLAATFAGMPTQDEALKEAKAGTAPGVEMKGKSDEKTRDQDKKVDGKGEETVKTARDDSGRRMGEDQVYPNAPKEELKGKVPGRERSKGGAKPEGAGTGAVPEDAASEVAEHERGKQFKSSFSKGEQGLADAKRNKDKNTRESKRKHQQSVDSETTKNTGKQSSQRQKTTSEVSGQRDKWRTDQDEELKKLGSKKSDKRTKAERDVDKQEKDTDDKADKRKRDDGDKIRKKGQDAESSAKTKRTETKNESGNWVEEAFEYIKQKFIELRDKILSILREARNKIIEFVENFKFDIEKMINDIRDAIINLITKVIEELVELAKAMVRAIVELANKIRKFITDLIEAAIALVQKLAEQLKQIITDLLNAIAKLLNDILNLLKKAWDAAVKAVKDAVKAVMDFASKLLSGLGQFMMIAADFLRDPGGWLSGLKGSAEDGAQNHLFKQVVGAVKNWFNQKIEEIIGLPKEIFNRLIKGGVTLAWMAKQVWDAIVPQLPFIIGEIVITKVVAKLIPGAGWVLAVIDFLQTAIGALGEIMRAFGAVLTWLKNVRKGGAGVLFAKAVAAGIVAVLELAYEFLLDGIGKYVGKVGDRLKGMAEKIATKGRRKKKPGHGAEGEDSSRGHQRPRQRTNSSGPDNTRPGEGRRDSRGRRSDEGDNGDRRTDERRNDTGRRDNSRDEKDRERQDDRTSPSSAARQAAHKPGGKPGPDRDTAKPERTHNDRGRNENDQDRRRREDNDRDQRPDKDNPDFRDRKPTDRDDSPAAKDKDGNPKGKRDEDKPDTKPTPNAKPKPKADKPQKPREDTGTTKDRQKNDRNEDDTGPKNDDKGTTNRKDDDDPGHEAKDKDSNERKNDDSNDKRERDKDDDRRDKRKNSNSKDNTNKTRPPRRDNRNKAKEDDRERRRIKEDRRGEEESNGFKSARLALIVARIRRALRPRLSQGLPQPLHKGLLRAFRRWYRLTSLVRAGSTRFQDVATLNPSLPVTSGEHSATDEKDYLKIPEDPALPPTRIPDFSDNKLARNFKAEYISKRFVGSHGQTAGKANKQLEPIGFRHLNKYDLNTDSSNRWVRMHLLTERLGGPAKGSNLVPARSRINTNFKNSIEKFPESHVRSGSKKPAWYKIDVNYHNGSVPGFPSHLRAEWGVYEPDPDKQKWKEKPAPHHRSHSRSDLEKPPQPSIENRCYVNHDGKNRIRRMLDVPDSFAKLIVAAVKSKNRNLRSTTQLLRAMDDVHKKRKRSLPNYTNNKQNVIDAAANRHLIFNKKP
ncbi:hypothetical protein [Saccharopolyspora aridisoli]|uniref:hypothetical protein n=1 Tax=Saccharopolyspora aridisoli TaxID=2530385 RepID=UPI001A9DE312|nr:hypothetical protein [Saccharopolyspora aridisoli]